MDSASARAAGDRKVKYRGVRVASFVPGRVRIKLGTMMSDPGLLGALEAELGAVPGVEKIDFGKFTGSVLIVYDGKTLRTSKSVQALESICKRHFPELDLATARKWLRNNSW
jgi:hypothetical protein